MEVGVLARMLSRAAVVVLSGAACTWAANDGFQVAIAPGSQAGGTPLGAKEMKLKLQDAIGMALHHNLAIEVSRYGVASAGQGLLGSTGIFDPVLTGDVSAAESNSPATNQLVGAAVNTQRRRTFDLSLKTLLPTGGTASVGWTNGRNATNSSFYFLNPSYSSGLTVGATQPLLNGFGSDVTRAGIEVARRTRDISELQFRQLLIDTVQQVEAAYWNLVYRRDDLLVRQSSLRLANELLDQTRTRVRIGTLAPIEIVQSEAAVAAREQDIILAENAVLNAEDLLKGLMGFETPEDWSSRVTPTDSLVVSPPSTPGLAESIARALEERLELKMQALDTEIKRVSLVSAHNDVKPQLDLQVGYGYSGVGGEQRDPNTGEVIARGAWGDAITQVRNFDYKQWSAALNFRLPLGNHQAKAQLAQRRFDVNSSRQQLAIRRQTVIEDVRKAVRDIDASAKSVAAAEKARVLAERNLDAEQKKFANGMSTNFQVTKIQDDLAAAQVSELQARVSYHLAIVQYQVAVGSLLDEQGVTVRESESVQEPHTWLAGASWAKYETRVDDLEGDGSATGSAGKRAGEPAAIPAGQPDPKPAGESNSKPAGEPAAQPAAQAAKEPVK